MSETELNFKDILRTLIFFSGFDMIKVGGAPASP